ncbi:unnamed protein product [Protopolystoma xenopodis]|uniref:Uncharacterized protein n=1 Tax=Protopolystoma xenopodis TaxID=117903 RepID=A0A3S5AWP9_9PLAT|nr:unnamed protein product [Protopolystoma xenopodis]
MEASRDTYVLFAPRSDLACAACWPDPSQSDQFGRTSVKHNQQSEIRSRTSHRTMFTTTSGYTNASTARARTGTGRLNH